MELDDLLPDYRPLQLIKAAQRKSVVPGSEKNGGTTRTPLDKFTEAELGPKKSFC